MQSQQNNQNIKQKQEVRVNDAVFTDEKGRTFVGTMQGDGENRAPLHGSGTFYLKAKNREEMDCAVTGTWVDGQLQGDAILKFINGNYYIGNIDNDNYRKSPYGIYYKKETNVFRIDCRGQSRQQYGMSIKDLWCSENYSGYQHTYYDKDIGSWRTKPVGAYKNLNVHDSYNTWMGSNELKFGYAAQHITTANGTKINTKGTILPDNKFYGQCIREEVGKDGYKSEYEGQMFANHFHGKGKISYKLANGETRSYDGNFHNGQMHGKGKISYKLANGVIASYNGNFHKDQMHGKGKLTVTNECTHYIWNGEFQNDQMHGKGVFIVNDIQINGTMEQGLFIPEKGQQVTLRNGATWDGPLLRGRPHGKGTMTFPSGHKYEGEMQNGVRHGEGIYTWSDGGTEYGTFQNDEMVKGTREGKGSDGADLTIITNNFCNRKIYIREINGEKIYGVYNSSSRAKIDEITPEQYMGYKKQFNVTPKEAFAQKNQILEMNQSLEVYQQENQYNPNMSFAQPQQKTNNKTNNKFSESQEKGGAVSGLTIMGFQ